MPDLLFQLLIFGALSVAFIPIFTELTHQKGDKEAFHFANNIMNLALIAFGLVSVMVIIFASPLNSVVVPGFSGEQKILTDQLTRIIIFSEVLLVIGSMFYAIAQAQQRFIITSLAPLFYNLGIIFGIGVLSHFFGIMGPAYGAILGALLHAAIQFPVLKSLGYRYQISFNIFDKEVKEVFKLLSIRNIALVVEQLNETVGVALASLVTYSSVTVLTFSQHLQAVPIGLFGATIAQTALPVLAREKARGEDESFKITLLTTFHQILFLTLPAAAILIILRIPVVRLVFGASQFSWEDTVLTGLTVAFFSLGLTAQSAMLLIVRGFYALKDTKTPVTISVLTVGLNIVLSFLFVRFLHLGVWSLGLSYSISSNLSLIFLMHFLDLRIGGFERKALYLPAAKMVLATVVSAIALYIPIKAFDQLVFDTTRTINLIFLTGIAAAFGLGIYLILVWLMDVQELNTFAGFIKKIGKLQENIRTEELLEDPGNV